MIAHPLHANAFLDTHAYNFPFVNNIVKNIVDGKKREWKWEGALKATLRSGITSKNQSKIESALKAPTRSRITSRMIDTPSVR